MNSAGAIDSKTDVSMLVLPKPAENPLPACQRIAGIGVIFLKHGGKSRYGGNADEVDRHDLLGARRFYIDDGCDVIRLRRP
jgi:hypothetical protein